MKVSLNWVKLMNSNYGCSDSSELKDIGKLVEKIGAQLGAVEEVIDLGKKYQGLLIVKVTECRPHPNADKLSLCLVDDGGVNKQVERKEGGLIQIVCGAPNVKAGQLAVWIPPGSVVPATFDKDPFVIEARPIRNKTSHGMLASPKELGLGDSHEGILILDEGKAGEDFAPKLRLDDYIIDIENKMFTHRPDCFGILGVARELAGINGKSYKSPDWYKEDAGLPSDGRKSVLELSFKNELPDLVPRFCAAAIKDVKVAPSPVWLQSFLIRSGIRPINNIVDITNWFMVVTGQPLHAYDYDKIKTGTLGVRMSRTGEQLALLNGKTITFKQDAVVITDGQRPIGLGGVMGGADTEVDEHTKNIILECANFDMNQTRRTAMEYGLFTDAATRFTKNQSPRQNMAVLVKTVNDTLALVGGRVASPVIDDKHFSKGKGTVKVTADFINSRLGVDLSAAEMAGLLENVEFKVNKAGGGLTVTVPFWRTDIEIPEDIVEEVGRLHGYDKLPQNLPKRPLEPVSKNRLMEFKDEVRQILSEFGANEVLTYSFAPSDLLKKAGQDPKSAYEISNSLSPNLQYYRFDLVPSLLDKIHANVKLGFDKFAFFEIGKGHDKDHKDKAGLPQEFELLSLVYTASAKIKSSGAAYYQARRYLDQLAARLGLQLIYRPLDKLPNAQLAQMYQLSRTAMVSTADGAYLGIIGELKESVRRQLKLSEHTAAFEIDIEALCEAGLDVKAYQPLPRFPQTYQDLCLRSDSGLSYQQLTDFVYNQLADAARQRGYEYGLEPLDIYQAAGDTNRKQTTWRISLWHPERTLTTDETNDLMDELAGAAKKELKAERI
jgi:phenylalanyl-tRNA synthetase beta chain